MDTQKVAREVQTGERGTEVKELAGGIFLIPSFSSPHKSYKVGENYCTCMHYMAKGVDTPKHQVTRRAIQAARLRPFFTRADEAVLLEMCRKVFSPARSYRESYELAVEVSYYPYATEEMREAAFGRHRKMVDAYTGEAA